MAEETPDLGELLRARPAAVRDRGQDRRPRSTGPGWAILAMVAAGALVLAGYLVAGDEAEPAPTTTVAAGAVDFPPGYVNVDGVSAIRAERALLRDGTLFLTVSTAVRRGLDPESSVGFGGGRWELVVEGDRVVAAEAEIIEGLAPGTLTVVFPASGIGPNDPVLLRLTAVALRSSATVTETIDLDALPFERTDLSELPLDAGVALRVDRVSLRPDGGDLEWSLGAADDVTAVVTATVVIRESFNDISPGVMLPVSLGRRFATVIGDPATSGALALTPPSLDQTGSLLDADIVWEVAWAAFTPATVEIPLDDLIVDVAS